MKSRYKSALRDPEKSLAILTKIKTLSDIRARAVAFDYLGKRYNGHELTSFTITPASATGTVVFNDGVTTFTFDLADIEIITRLRSRRWSIKIADLANPAE